MPKKGIHPVVQSVTYVLKNGASVELPSILQRAVPYTLQSVRALQSEQFQPPISLLHALQADLAGIPFRTLRQIPCGLVRRRRSLLQQGSQPK